MKIVFYGHLSEIDLKNTVVNNINKKYFYMVIKILKYFSVIGFFYCFYGLSTVLIKNYSLLVSPLYTEGIIVGYENVSIRHNFNSSSSAFSIKLPIVEFKNAHKNVFKVTAQYGDEGLELGDTVSVIYVENDPTISMVDKGFINNWLELYIYLFTTVGFFLGIRRFSSLNKS